MKTLVLLIAFVALGTIALGSSRSRGIRLASRLVSFIGFMFFGLITVACVYGMFALEGKGAGVLLFIAIPGGIITALFFFAFTSSRGTEAFAAQPLREQLDQTRSGVEAEIPRLERRIAAAEEKRARFWTTSATRERLRMEIARDQRMLAELRKLQAALHDPQRRSGVSSS